MENINQYIFDLAHVLAHLRDTLEYVLPHEHDVKLYEQRKAVLKKAIEEDTPLGKFIKNNIETPQFKELNEKYRAFLEEIYGDKSKIITKTPEGKIRVDHSQHVKIYQYVTEIAETIKDILYYHANIAKKEHKNEAIIEDLLHVDDNYFRLFVYLLMIQDFQKSFFEFQKAMSESKGQPTAVTNYIVQNELMVLAKIFRNLRSHTRFTDNRTLDLLDETIKLIEMTEGRRDRINDKSFQVLFKENIEKLNEYFTKEVTPKWKENFNKALTQMLEEIKKNTEANSKKDAA